MSDRSKSAHSGRGPSAWGQNMPTIQELAGQFPQLEIQRMIGRGGMGAIYQARQTALDRDVALKIITKEVSDDPMFVERFEREAKALAKLSHPNIVTVFDFGRTASGMAYLIMEFVDGVNLREAIATKSVGAEDALGLIATMCHALDYAHAKGVVHRDIKPENILLGEDGSLKIADFGIAKIVDDVKHPPTLTATRQILGSLHYLAPEQIESPEQVDHRVDLYALGVVFYELLTGQLPLGNFEPPSSVLPRLDKRIDAIVLKTLSRKPALRYQNASQLKSDIDQVSSGNLAYVASVGDSHRPSSASVPFHVETFAGLGKIIGSVQATSNSLKIEYRATDNIFGGIKSQLHTLVIPVDQLINVSVKHGVFGSTLVIAAVSASILGELPEGESGRVQLKVQRLDRELAERVVQTLGFTKAAAPIKAFEHWNPTQAILLAICALLNGGFIAAVMAALAQSENRASDVPEIGVAVLFGSIMLLQLIGSILHITCVANFPYRAAMIASLLPVTPVALFTIPLAIWYFIEAQTTSNVTSGAGSPKSWGETTMIFIRENRAARWFSILNAGGFAGLLIGSVVFFAGWYPSTLRYRIVGSIDQEISMVDLVSRRLIDHSRIHYSARGADRLDIKIWACDLREVQESLSIEKSPELILIPSKQFASDDTMKVTSYSLGVGLEVKEADVAIGAGANLVTCFKKRIPMNSGMIKSIEKASSSARNLHQHVSIELTAKGRQEITELMGLDTGIVAIGLLVDDVIQGIAPLTEKSSQQLDIEFANNRRLSVQSLAAAIRGPELPFDLELLK